jgi:hypothetical protein
MAEPGIGTKTSQKTGQTGQKTGQKKQGASKAASGPPPSGGRAERETDAGAAVAAPPSHVCSVAFCPIGMALTSIQGAGPEVLDHLLAAAREFLLAARAVVDARAADFEGTDGAGGFEKIEIG